MSTHQRNGNRLKHIVPFLRIGSLLLLLLFGVGGARAPARKTTAKTAVAKPLKATARQTGFRKRPQKKAIGQRIVERAETYLGVEYVWGGRMGMRGCLQNGRRVACQQGLDCQSLIFFVFEDLFKKKWNRFSVMPSKNVRRRELGHPVPGMSGVLREKLDPKQLQPGDVVFFMLPDYNFDVDPPLWIHNGVKYGVWHTAIFHGFDGKHYNIIHANPGDKVMIDPIEEIHFEALYVLRWPERKAVR